MKYIFDNFWKPISPFSKFLLTVFLYFTSYTLNIVLWQMLMEPVKAPAC